MPMSDALSRLLTPDALRRAAGQRSFERGEGYAAHGSVRNLQREGEAITATVRGTRPYTVTLGVIDGGLEYDCTCPHAADGNFCKHCVALGLAWLEQEKAPPKEKPITRRDVRKWLENRNKKELVELLLDHAETDDRLDRRLTLATAQAVRGPVSKMTFERALDDALGCDGYVAWDEMYEYTKDIDDVVDSIEDLLSDGRAGEVVDLAETALARVESAFENVDDSGGYLGMVLDRLQTLHLKACKRARPDPIALAERLFEGELQTGFDTFCDAVGAYASVLGAAGIARHRELVEAEWARVPERKPGSRSHVDGRCSTITHMMEALAERSGDVEARVAVMSRDLTYPGTFLRIAEAYEDADRLDDALAWAERGLATFPKRINEGLRQFVAGEYHRRGRHDEAMDLIWASFIEAPGLDRFQQLKQHAQRCNGWPEWRERALEVLRTSSAARKKRSSVRRWGPGLADESILVEVFLWEHEPELAWDEAVAGGCSRNQWLALAAHRERDHPEDALDVYRNLIDPIVDLKNKGAYGQAVALLEKIRVLLERLGREGEFLPYVAGVRVAHRNKRNFTALLDAAAWSRATRR